MLITGGASGLGKATAQRFAQEGAKIIIADVDDDGKALADDLADCAFIKTDVTDVEAVKQSIQYAVDTFGSCDIIFNNAGIDGEQKITHQSTLDNWNKVNDINLNGAFYYLNSMA